MRVARAGERAPAVLAGRAGGAAARVVVDGVREGEGNG
jgi:hypothetical protein